MGRAFLTVLFLIASGAAPAAAQQFARAATGEAPVSKVAAGKAAADPAAAQRRKLLREAVNAAPSAGPARRRPAAQRPRSSADHAASARELARRLEILAPGTKLGETIPDPAIPPWRRPGRAADRGELSLPLDAEGRAGLVARGYSSDPAWNNPNGTMGATFGLRTRF